MPSPPSCAQAAERAQRLAGIWLMLGFCLLPALAPRAYLRWRPHFVTALRLVYWSFPLLRQPKGERAHGLLAAAPVSLPTATRQFRFPHACHCPGAPGGDALPASPHLPAASAGIQRVLEREPTAGAAGALLDALRVAWGACPRSLAPGAVLEQRPALGRRCLCACRLQHAYLDPLLHPHPCKQAPAYLPSS